MRSNYTFLTPKKLLSEMVTCVQVLHQDRTCSIFVRTIFATFMMCVQNSALIQVQSKYQRFTVISKTSPSTFNFFRMANFQQEDMLDYEDDLRGDNLFGPHGQEKPMELNDSILNQ